MTNQDFEAGRRFEIVESRLWELIESIENIAGPSAHVKGMREGLLPEIKKAYEEYSQIANKYHVLESKEISEFIANLDSTCFP